jgi:hypothetical protein
VLPWLLFGEGASGRSDEWLREWHVNTGGSPPVRAWRVASSSPEASEERELNVSEDGVRMSRPTMRLVDGGGDTKILLSMTTESSGQMREGRR